MPVKAQPKKPKIDVLLAKSFKAPPWRGAYTLTGHTAAVVEATTTLVHTLGDCLIPQFGLDQSLTDLKATARLAAFLHDLGKANHHFQLVVYGRRHPTHEPQLIRHEIASILLAWQLRDWLQNGKGDFLTALAAAGGHHLKLGGKAGKDTSELGEVRQAGDRLYLYTDHPHFTGLLRYGVRQLGLPQTLPEAMPTCWQIIELKKLQQTVLDCFSDWQPDPVFTAVVKALLVAGDAVGSALPMTNLKIEQWIQSELNQTLTETNLQNVIDARLVGKKLRPFQQTLGEAKARVTLAQAGCGTGKTLGAYNWAKHHAIGRKLFFCYPTTGTSTEGFLDYVDEELHSVLLHSRAEVDLELAKREMEDLTTTGEEEEAGDGTENERAKKLESFKAWGKEASICTVDTVLGLLQCNRRPMYCFPAIAQAAFVFDEVHCYDNCLFGALLRFLEVVKAPILLMSASFLPWQREMIETAVGEQVEIIPGPQDLEELPRYRFHLVEAPDWQQVEQELKSGGKVLWVCNQVNTAINVYRQARKRGLNALLYHSRYCYKDRVQHHRDVVGAFREKKTEPVLAIATQVAEMSLDLSATLLVSQIADPAGLIQRLGRLNRRYCGQALDAIFYPDDKVGYPYSNKELDAGKALIQTFTREVCQADLAEWLEKSDFRGRPERDSVLLDGKWRMYPTSLRDAGYTTTALLEQDLPRVSSLPMNLLPRYTVPLPVKTIAGWRRHRGYPVAPSDQWSYCSETGANEIKRS